MSRNAPNVSVKKLGAPADAWVAHASVQRQKEKCGYDAAAIAEAVKDCFKAEVVKDCK